MGDRIGTTSVPQNSINTTARHFLYLSNHTSEVRFEARDDLAISVRLMKEYITPVIFLLGIIGNTVNLVVLSHKSLKRNMEHLEKSATLGLISLAISDLLFCCIGFPTLFLKPYGLTSGSYPLSVVSFYYETYEGPLLNTFLFSSTWIITVISLERFVGVCFPYQACTVINVGRTMFIHGCVFVTSVIINLPLFFEYRIEQAPCFTNSSCYVKVPAWFSYQTSLNVIHLYVWLTLGTFIPLLILIFCNASMLRALYEHRKMRAEHASEEYIGMMRLTWILVGIVLLFFILVCPSMILQMVIQSYEYQHFNDGKLSLALTITNLMQALKFSSNFLLYCGLHKKFRKVLTCRLNRTTERSFGSQYIFNIKKTDDID